MNPFNPSFGKVPELFLDRKALVKKVTDGLENINSPYQTSLVYGLRGSGKTSFLTDISNLMQQKENWIVVNLALGSKLIPTLIDSIYKKATSTLKKALSRIENVKFSALGLQLEVHQNVQVSHNYQILLESILQKLKENGISLLVTIDEVSSTPEIREFISIYQILIREGYHVALMMTGLPGKISELQNDDVLTFLLRSARITLKPLDLASVKYAYLDAFEKAGRRIETAALNEMTKLTRGYAYSFQLMGYLIWETNQKVVEMDVLNSVIGEYQQQLFRNVYTKLYLELSPVDREFVKKMAAYKDDIVPVAYLRKALNKDKNYISVYRKRLLDDQLIAAAAHGQLSFTLPYFKNFVNENAILYES